MMNGCSRAGVSDLAEVLQERFSGAKNKLCSLAQWFELLWAPWLWTLNHNINISHYIYTYIFFFWKMWGPSVCIFWPSIVLLAWFLSFNAWHLCGVWILGLSTQPLRHQDEWDHRHCSKSSLGRSFLQASVSPKNYLVAVAFVSPVEVWTASPTEASVGEKQVGFIIVLG